MATRTCRVGLHGRNHPAYEEVDYQVIREARIETMKMMNGSQVLFMGVECIIKRSTDTLIYLPFLQCFTRIS